MSIKDLTQNAVANGHDLVPIWDITNNRTRSVDIDAIKEYAAADEVVNAKIVDDHLILIKEDGSEIDAGELPSHAGINISDSGYDQGNFTRLDIAEGLSVEDDGVTATIRANSAIEEVLTDVRYGDALNPIWLDRPFFTWRFKGKLEILSNWFFNDYNYETDPSVEIEVHGFTRVIQLENGNKRLEMTAYYDGSDRPEGYYKAGDFQAGTYTVDFHTNVTGQVNGSGKGWKLKVTSNEADSNAEFKLKSLRLHAM